ncbi:phage tail protein [Rhizobium sp. CC-YZS058]|uniref:phage tail protein n=1 Tax=Rhizobium sp. CC-YZS058 TaxID=3042153 RepID=UPI002B05369F|nr:phage tail protein [Rhizobium sp. CC-YZS058]MEA3533733.1 phage tail protein [Rhizobium sp. CC-YZS058]
MNRTFALCTTALTALLLTPAAAHADPISGIISVFSAIAGGATLGQVALSLAISVGSSLLQMALTDTPQQKPVGVELQVKVGDDQPQSTTMGTFATRGKLKYSGSYGDLDGVPNSHVSEVYELGNIPGVGLKRVHINGEPCTILWNEMSSRGAPIMEYREGGKDYAWVRFYDGSQTTADPYLRSKLGTDKQRPYLATMVGIGTPYAVMSYRYNRDKWYGQPKAIFELDPLPLYDVRRDSSVGGNGSHRWGNKATYEPSNNLALMAYNLIRGLTYKDEWFYGGQDVAAHRLPAANWIAAAQECARQIDLSGGGTESQFRGGYELTVDMQPYEVLNELAKAMGARIVEVGGIFKIQVGALPASVYAFTDEDVVTTEKAGLDPFPTLDKTINAVNAVYPEPDEGWEAKDAPALQNADYLARDGKRLPADLRFAAAPFKRQVQRLMRAALKEEQRWRKHQLTLPPEAWLLEPGIDIVTWSSEHNGYNNKRFIVDDITGDIGMNQVVTLREVDPSDYDWSSSYELPTSTGWRGQIDVPVLPMQGWLVQPAIILDGTGKPRRPAIRISCSGDLDRVERVSVEVRHAGSKEVIYKSDRFPYVADYNWLLSGNWCLPNSNYEVRGKLIMSGKGKSDWSDWLAVQTSDTRFSAEDLHLQEVTADVQNSLSSDLNWIWGTSNTRDLSDKVDRLARGVAEQDLQNFLDKQTLRREVSARTGAMQASFDERIIVATSATESIAGQITTITAKLEGKAEAQAFSELAANVVQQGDKITAQATLINGLKVDLDDVSAEGRIKFEGLNDGTNAGFARIGVQVRYGTQSVWRSAGFFVDMPADPAEPSRFIINAKQLAFSTSEDPASALVTEIFLVDGTGMSVNGAFIKNLTTDRITFLDESVLDSAMARNAVSEVYLEASNTTVEHTAGTTTLLSLNVPKEAVDAVTVLADVRVRATSIQNPPINVTVQLRDGVLLIGEGTCVITETGLWQTIQLQGTVVSGTGNRALTLTIEKDRISTLAISRRTLVAERKKKAVKA